jgi:putative endonuclease
LNWCVYIIRCSDDTLYTGITNNLERRLEQHATQRGATYFRGRKPEAIVYVENGHDRSSASKREAEIKKLERAEKVLLITSEMNVVAQTLTRQTDM